MIIWYSMVLYCYTILRLIILRRIVHVKMDIHMTMIIRIRVIRIWQQMELLICFKSWIISHYSMTGNFIHIELWPLTNNSSNIFAMLFYDAAQPLYSSCKASKLSFIVKLLHLKTRNRWINKAFTMLFRLLTDILPPHRSSIFVLQGITSTMWPWTSIFEDRWM